MATKIFEVIRPKSLTDSAYADYEYLIRWRGRTGADYILMFYDAEIEQRVENSVINQSNSNTIQSLNRFEEKTVRLTASDLTLNDIQIVGQMFSNKYVTRIHKDGVITRFAPVGNSFNYRLLAGRYELNIQLQAVDLAVYR